MFDTQITTNITAAVALLGIVAFSMIDGDTSTAREPGASGATPLAAAAKHDVDEASADPLFAFFGKRFEGEQLHMHADGDPVAYVRDMLLKKAAEKFFVPDDHIDGVRRHIERQITKLERDGDTTSIGFWLNQLGRLEPLGKTFDAVQRSAMGSLGKAWRLGRVPRHGKAAAMYVAAVDGGILLYRVMDGQLTPKQARQEAAEVGVKAAAVGGTTAAAVALGANPAGIVVMVVGGVTYFVVDLAIGQLRPSYRNNPLSVEEIHALMPPGWKWDDPMQMQQQAPTPGMRELVAMRQRVRDQDR